MQTLLQVAKNLFTHLGEYIDSLYADPTQYDIAISYARGAEISDQPYKGPVTRSVVSQQGKGSQWNKCKDQGTASGSPKSKKITSPQKRDQTPSGSSQSPTKSSDVNAILKKQDKLAGRIVGAEEKKSPLRYSLSPPVKCIKDNIDTTSPRDRSNRVVEPYHKGSPEGSPRSRRRTLPATPPTGSPMPSGSEEPLPSTSNRNGGPPSKMPRRGTQIQSNAERAASMDSNSRESSASPARGKRSQSTPTKTTKGSPRKPSAKKLGIKPPAKPTIPSAQNSPLAMAIQGQACKDGTSGGAKDDSAGPSSEAGGINDEPVAARTRHQSGTAPSSSEGCTEADTDFTLYPGFFVATTPPKDEQKDNATGPLRKVDSDVVWALNTPKKYAVLPTQPLPGIGVAKPSMWEVFKSSMFLGFGFDQLGLLIVQVTFDWLQDGL